MESQAPSPRRRAPTAADSPGGIVIHPGTKADDTLGSKKAVPGGTFSDPKLTLQVIDRGVRKLNTAVASTNARIDTLSTRIAAVDERTARTDEKVDSHMSATARNGEGRTLIGIADDMLNKLRLICKDNVVTGPLGIGGGDHEGCR